MGRAPCCDKANVKKGPWSPEEDAKLKNYIHNHGTGGNWIALPQKAGLKRCGKSCRLRWLNYLRPNIKHGEFSDDEDRIICSLFSSIGSRWSIIAAHLPGRTDNDIKNYWNTKLKKKLFELSPLINPHPKSTPQINIYPTPNHNSFLQNYSPNFNIYGTSGTPPRVFSNPSTVFQAQESMGPTNYNNSLMMFKNEASCSTSSDASGGVDEELGFLSFLGSTTTGTTGVNDETHDQKINICNNHSANDYQNKAANDELDYSIEEITQLISSNNDDDDRNHLNYFEDEIIKTEFEQVLYY